MKSEKLLSPVVVTGAMRMPEQPPELNGMSLDRILHCSSETMDLAREYNGRYLHWSDLEYRDVGTDSREVLWYLMKILRRGTERSVVLGDLKLSYNVTDDAQRILHELDMRLTSGLVPNSKLDDKRRLLLTVSSIMEESIASSQMEGASTTTKAAKKMLRENKLPTNRSERMIFNNYNAMRFIKDHAGDRLTPELIREVHSIISKDTLEDPSYEGRFREDNSIAVRDILSGETFHNPPDHTKIADMVTGLCAFANDDRVFVHPVVKGIILHFSLAYIHPFMDGNGRVSRSLFYWYLLRSGYASMEYLSISKVMKSHRGRYDQAYLLSETDDNDVTYFINFNLEVVSEAADRFLEYVRRKIEENERSLMDPRVMELNARQRDVLADLMNSNEPLDVYELSSKHMVQTSNIRRDLQKLNDMGLAIKARQGRRVVYAYRK